MPGFNYAADSILNQVVRSEDARATAAQSDARAAPPPNNVRGVVRPQVSTRQNRKVKRK